MACRICQAAAASAWNFFMEIIRIDNAAGVSPDMRDA
jgi:hypothetical protein